VERESCHHATEENMWNMKEWKLPYYREHAELITPTPVPAQPLISCMAVGNAPSYSFSVCFCEVPWTREDPPECKKEQIKKWQ